ncbi:hypothetical protein [Kocuria arenosa]|uniref:hypothetical protein n=1 Tax=Kocuria arenosa TaxID=3071446 RepID=UPI0034D3CDC1
MRYTTYRRRTGLPVSEYALGTGNFGTGWSAGTEREEAKAVFDRFGEAGGNSIDTYQAGQSEQYDRFDEISRIEVGIPHQANAKALNGLQGGLIESFDAPVVPVA